jgi:hypothetical protein
LEGNKQPVVCLDLICILVERNDDRHADNGTRERAQVETY